MGALLVKPYAITKIKDWKIHIFLFVLFFILEIWLWKATDGIPAMMETGESYAAYVTGKNFVKYGLVKLGFLDDYAMSSSAEAHPYRFTHNPDFPVFITYAFQKIGLKSISAQTFIGIFILCIGLFYLYLTIKEYTGNEQTALFVLAVSVFSYAGVLVYSFNISRVWTWLVIFAPLYHLKRYCSEWEISDFWTGVVFYFFMTYYDYIYASFLTFAILSLKVFKFYGNLSWKRLFVFILLGTIPSFLLHKIIVITAIGPDIFLKDIYLTFNKRILGSATMKEIEDFYASNGIVLWRVEQVKMDMNYLHEFLATARARLGCLFGEVYLYVLAVFFSICTIKLLIETKLFTCFHDRLKPFLLKFSIKDSDAGFFVAFSVATILISLIFHIYVRGMFMVSLLPFFVFPVSIGGGILLSALVSNIRIAMKERQISSSSGSMRSGWKINAVIWCILLVFLIIYLMNLNYRHLTEDVPVESLPGSRILHKYKGRSFVTNYWDSYINYFTDEWVKMVWTSVDEESVDEFLSNDDHLFERDRFTNREKYQNPDFLFFYRKDENAVGRDDPVRIFKDYPLVEKGREFWIFDLRKGAG